ESISGVWEKPVAGSSEIPKTYLYHQVCISLEESISGVWEKPVDGSTELPKIYLYHQ
ncbi:hypothetical protein SK128_023256, partial [Halocaridina rubra]